MIKQWGWGVRGGGKGVQGVISMILCSGGSRPSDKGLGGRGPVPKFFFDLLGLSLV